MNLQQLNENIVEILQNEYITSNLESGSDEHMDYIKEMSILHNYSSPYKHLPFDNLMETCPNPETDIVELSFSGTQQEIQEGYEVLEKLEMTC